jgi:hypothetical protein
MKSHDVRQHDQQDDDEQKQSRAEESFGNFMLIDYFLYFLSRFHLFHFDTQRRTIFRGCVSGTQIVAREIEMWDFYLIMNSYLEWF